MISSLCIIQPQTMITEGGRSVESIVEENTKNILKQIPEPWDLEKFEEK